MSLCKTEPVPKDILLAKYNGIPLKALRNSTRKTLASFLNLDGQLISHIKYENNYRGLAELVGFTYHEIRNFERCQNPAEEMLHEWTDRMDLSPALGNLWNHLDFLERKDILMDCSSFFERDCEVYLQRKARFEPPVQEHTVSNSTDVVLSERSKWTFMTRHDVQYGCPTTYDAYVCYNDEGHDQDFVELLICKLERERNLKLFIPQRDELVGSEGDTTAARLIEHRCKRILVVLSPRFLASPSCEFQVQFAHSLDSGTRRKKIVPILIEKCDQSAIPETLRHLTVCDYTRTNLHAWFWDRLYTSLMVPLGAFCREDRLSKILAMRDQACQAHTLPHDDLTAQIDTTSSSTVISLDTLPASMELSSIAERTTSAVTSHHDQSLNPSNGAEFTSEQANFTSQHDHTCPNDNLSKGAEFVMYDRTLSHQLYSQFSNNSPLTTKAELETRHAVYDESGSPSSQDISPAGNQASVQKSFDRFARLSRKRSKSPPSQLSDLEPGSKAMCYYGRDLGPDTPLTCSRQPKIPVENEELEEYKDILYGCEMWYGMEFPALQQLKTGRCAMQWVERTPGTDSFSRLTTLDLLPTTTAAPSVLTPQSPPSLSPANNLIINTFCTRPNTLERLTVPKFWVHVQYVSLKVRLPLSVKFCFLSLEAVVIVLLSKIVFSKQF